MDDDGGAKSQVLFLNRVVISAGITFLYSPSLVALVNQKGSIVEDNGWDEINKDVEWVNVITLLVIFKIFYVLTISPFSLVALYHL